MAKKKLKDVFTKEVNSTLIHTVFGGFSGWLSFYVDRVLNYGTFMGILVGLALFALAGYTTMKTVNPDDKKWWLGNGGIVFILAWLIVGSIFATM